mmetsp:Transcript_23464/g.77727  ORF Transcript_23464/g.77727 Transcript_23464/m.77727 type:complete len:325 (+) Transcript_23464:510-1484(+)
MVKDVAPRRGLGAPLRVPEHEVDPARERLRHGLRLQRVAVRAHEGIGAAPGPRGELDVVDRRARRGRVAVVAGRGLPRAQGQGVVVQEHLRTIEQLGHELLDVRHGPRRRPPRVRQREEEAVRHVELAALELHGEPSKGLAAHEEVEDDARRRVVGAVHELGHHSRRVLERAKPLVERVAARRGAERAHGLGEVAPDVGPRRRVEVRRLGRVEVGEDPGEDGPLRGVLERSSRDLVERRHVRERRDAPAAPGLRELGPLQRVPAVAVGEGRGLALEAQAAERRRPVAEERQPLPRGEARQQLPEAPVRRVAPPRRGPAAAPGER